MKTRTDRSRGSTGDRLSRAEHAYRKALALAKRGRARYASRALPLLREAAAGGHGLALHALATWYIHGVGVRRNYRKAVVLERAAARRGVSAALFNLGFAYESGQGVEKNLRRAFHFYRRAADLGDRDAAQEVGRCLYYGIGVRRDVDHARKWLHKGDGDSGRVKASTSTQAKAEVDVWRTEYRLC